MSLMLVSWITNFGDTGVVLPLAVLLVCVLAYAESRRAAWLFARSMLACLAAMTALKIIFLSCGHRFDMGIASPSGHASLTTMFYGALTVVLWAQPRPVLRRLAVGTATLLIVAVAASRVFLHAHTWQEVVLGLITGGAALAFFARAYWTMAHPIIRLRRVGSVLAVAFLIAFGTVLPAEQILRNWVPFFQIGLCRA